MKNRDMPAKPTRMDTGNTTSHYDRGMQCINTVFEACPGLTKLETGAIAAMQGLLANSDRYYKDSVKIAVDAANDLFDQLENNNG